MLFDSLSVLVVRGGAVCLPTPPSWFSSFFFFLIGVKTPSAILSFRGYDHVGSNEVGVLQNAKENNFQRPAWEDVVLWYSLLMM